VDRAVGPLGILPPCARDSLVFTFDLDTSMIGCPGLRRAPPCE
jgi:hypothetical protein